MEPLKDMGRLYGFAVEETERGKEEKCLDTKRLTGNFDFASWDDNIRVFLLAN